MNGRNALIALLLTCCVGLGLALTAASNTSRNLREQVDSLTQQLETSRRDAELREAEAQRAEKIQPAPTPVSLPTPQRKLESPLTVSDDSGMAAQRSANWKAQFYLSEVEKFVALTPEQQASLRDRYAAAFATRDSKAPQSYREILKETLGVEVANQLDKAQRADEAKRDDEELSDETFSLSRKLALSKEQETSVGEVLRQVRDELKPLDAQVQVAMREAMSNHSGANPDQERLRLSYDQLKELSAEMKAAKDAALSQRLKSILTESQYNALLEQQASAPEGF